MKVNTYTLYNENVDRFLELTNKGVDMDSCAVFTTKDLAEMVERAREIPPEKYGEYFIDLYETDADDEFVEGSDFDGIENFIRRYENGSLQA